VPRGRCSANGVLDSRLILFFDFDPAILHANHELADGYLVVVAVQTEPEVAPEKDLPAGHSGVVTRGVCAMTATVQSEISQAIPTIIRARRDIHHLMPEPLPSTRELDAQAQIQGRTSPLNTAAPSVSSGAMHSGRRSRAVGNRAERLPDSTISAPRRGRGAGRDRGLVFALAERWPRVGWRDVRALTPTGPPRCIVHRSLLHAPQY
jgi:hypothetical protein